jgi:tetratricopeptide (TPR) repeat protein
MSENKSAALLQDAYAKLKEGKPLLARERMETALRMEETPELVFALKCVNWWLDRMQRYESLTDPYERGGFILAQWKSFYGFLDRIGNAELYRESVIYAMRIFVFSAALDCFKQFLDEGKDDPDILLRVGQCYKGIGRYDQAAKYLEQAARSKRDDGETLSCLADVNAMLEETRAAKALFREAFYADPQHIDLRSMESELILRLAAKVAELGYTGEELLEWIPIYGNIYGVFSVRRELKPVELGRLKQSIFTLENEVRSRTGGSQSPNHSLLVPRLINRYFWLIDHYENVQENPSMIEETLLKIRIVSPNIYELYIR